MKRWNSMGAVAGLVATTLFSGAAFAAGTVSLRGSMVPRGVASVASPEKVQGIFDADQDNLRNLRSQARTARQQLEADMLAGKSTAGDLQALETAQNKILAERVKLAEQVVGSLTPEQRAQVAESTSHRRSLRSTHAASAQTATSPPTQQSKR